MIAQCLAFVAVVIAVAALACGHQGADWPLTGTWRRVRAAWARARGCAPAWRPHRASRGSRDADTPERPAERRTRPRPSWAHEQPTTYEEAA